MGAVLKLTSEQKLIRISGADQLAPLVTLAAASASAASASASAAAASAAVYPNVVAAIGADVATAASAVYGSTTPDTTTWTNGTGVAVAAPTTAAGVLTSLSVRLSASGTGNIEILSMSGAILKTFPVTVAAGLNTFTAFSNYVVPAGSVVAYRRLTGGNVRYVAGTTPYLQYTDADAADLQVTFAFGATISLSLSFTLNVLAAAHDARIAALEQDDANSIFLTTGRDTSATQSTAYGATTPDTSSVANTDAYSSNATVAKAGLLTGGSIRLSAAALIAVQVYRLVTGTTYKLVYSQPVVIAASGVQSFTLPAPYFRLLPGDEVATRPISGSGRVRFVTGGGSYKQFVAATFPTVGSSGTGTTGSAQMAMSYTATESANSSVNADLSGVTGGSGVSAQQLKDWTSAGSYEVTAATISATTLLPTTATVKWPDGSAGTFTPTTVNATFNTIDAFTITHTTSGKTVTQAAVTRDGNGIITAKPALTVA